MVRGNIVINEEQEHFVFLSSNDGIANCAVVESIFDPYQGEDVSKVTSLRKIPIKTLIVAKTYPRFFDQINIA